MDSAAIENLAVNGRDPLVLARLAPGIADVGGGVGMNVNGGRDNTTNYTVDGVSNLDTGNNGVLGSINLDAVEEFKILTNAYSAEYRPVVGRAGLARDQERRPRLPRIGLRLPPAGIVQRQQLHQQPRARPRARDRIRTRRSA